MVPKLKIIPLGGLGEIGKNMTVFEYGNDIIIVDAGMGFPSESMYGIDVVYPDVSYLKSNAEKVRGLILTHGHEDHIGGLPYFLKKFNVPTFFLVKEKIIFIEEKNYFPLRDFYVQGPETPVQRLCTVVQGP